MRVVFTFPFVFLGLEMKINEMNGKKGRDSPAYKGPQEKFDVTIRKAFSSKTIVLDRVFRWSFILCWKTEPSLKETYIAVVCGRGWVRGNYHLQRYNIKRKKILNFGLPY